MNTNANDTLVLASRASAEWLRAEQHFGAADLMTDMADAIVTLQTALVSCGARAEALQRTINKALSQSPAATIVEIDDGLGTTFLEFNEPRGPAGTNYYAAPVPSQPAADCWTQDQIDHVRAKASEMFSGAASKPLAEDQPAVVPEGPGVYVCSTCGYSPYCLCDQQ